MDPFKHKKFFKFIFLIKNGQTTIVLFLMLGNFPKDFSFAVAACGASEGLT